jgi:hypothetical protein
MKHIKLFEDYSDEDLAGLISDLDGVGLIDKTIVSFEGKIPIPHQSAHPSWWPEPCGKFAIVEVSSPEKNPNVEQMAFEKIKNGDFTQDLSELNSDAYREGIHSILKFFSSESIQKKAQESRNVEEFKTRIHEKTGQILFNEWEILVDDHLNGRSEAEVKEFFDTPWKSTPKSAKLAITKCTEIKVSKKEVKP